MPFFTVIIPTRNRPDLVPIALQSVLEQTFRDFEVIVSDNSDEANSTATRAALESLLSDPRVRYVRPPSIMPMTEHWEWATRQASGEFAGVLTDRLSYRLHALSRCWEAIQAHSTELVSFGGGGLTSDTPPYSFRGIDDRSGAHILESSAILADCSRSITSMARLPRMLNSFCRTSRLRRLIEEYGSIYTGYSPDFSFCFRILDQVEAFVSLDDRLLVSGWESRSNGHAFLTNKMNQASSDYLAMTVTSAKEWLAYAPLPAAPFISENAILLEYEVARRQQRSGRLPPIDKTAFYYGAQRTLRKLLKEGNSLAAAVDALEAYRVEHDIPTRSAALVGRIRRLQHGPPRGLGGLGPALGRLGRYAGESLAALARRRGPRNANLGFPTVIELLRHDAANLAQARKK